MVKLRWKIGPRCAKNEKALECRRRNGTSFTQRDVNQHLVKTPPAHDECDCTLEREGECRICNRRIENAPLTAEFADLWLSNTQTDEMIWCHSFCPECIAVLLDTFVQLAQNGWLDTAMARFHGHTGKIIKPGAPLSLAKNIARKGN
jgi:hypothetical protein